MKKILVTGASGYIGKHVVQKLLETNEFHITAVSRNDDYFGDDVNLIYADIFSTEQSLINYLPETPDILLHLAWEKGFQHNSIDHINNLPKHFSFISSLIDRGVKQVAVIGSMHEIGYWEGEIDEMTPTNPLSLYGIAKNSLRQSLEILCKEKNVIFQWLRCFYVYGDDEKNSSIFSKICHLEKLGEKTIALTDGKNKYDFIDVDNLAEQITKCVSQSKINGIINCCSGNPVSLKDKIDQFLKENNLKIKPIYGAYPSRPYDSPALWGNDEKIKKIMFEH